MASLHLKSGLVKFISARDRLTTDETHTCATSAHTVGTDSSVVHLSYAGSDGMNKKPSSQTQAASTRDGLNGNV